MRIKLNVKRHLVALIITLCIFVIGVLIGIVLTGTRLQYMQDKTFEQNLDFESIQAQYLYLTMLNENQNCPAVLEAFDSNLKNLESARMRLEAYDEEAKISENSHTLLKREYTIAQVRYWLLAKEVKKTCEKDMATILYFYSKDCADCQNQAMILDYLKKIFKDRLLIFSLDADLNEPLIPILKKAYDIDDYPSLVIEGKTFKGLTIRKTILQEICSYYKNDKEGCLNEEAS